MMIKPSLCCDCHQPKKMRESLRCRRCNNIHSMKRLNVNWTPEENESLKLIYRYRQELHTLTSELYRRHSYLAVIERARRLGIQVKRAHVMKASAPIFDGAGKSLVCEVK